MNKSLKDKEIKRAITLVI
ncbi:hypothetical protein [Aquimarina litoralis]